MFLLHTLRDRVRNMEFSDGFKKEQEYPLTEKDLRWNRFIDEVCSGDFFELSGIRKNAVLCFRYDAQMHNGGHALVVNCCEDVEMQDLMDAILAVGYREIADNLEKAVREGEKDDWLETDRAYYGFSPSLSDCLRDYVEQHKDAIFERAQEKRIPGETGEKGARRKYRRFEKLRKILGIGMILPLLPILWFFVKATIADDGAGILLWLGVLFLYLVFITVTTSFLVKHEPGSGNHSEIIHTGLFGAIWEELDGFPPKELVGGKVKHLETYNNTIDLWVVRNRHEFLIEIDRKAVSVIVDEESDSPVEWEKKLSEFADIEEFWSVLKNFILQHS